MKEDQTQLINARLEHLRFMMESGHMPVFRHRSDMFLFALEAHNIARGLSSRYYRLQEDLDIRFFVRFRFDYWLSRLQQWIEQLGGAEYRVDDDNFFAEGRAKRLTIVVDRLFGYHTDKIPADSKEGSMPLPDDEILPPFRAILDMKSTALVTSFRDALREVHTYLLRLAKSPVSWPVEKRRKAMQLYLDDARQTAKVQGELSEYEYFCAMPDSRSVRGQFCYLKQRLLALAGNGELAQLKLARSEQQALLQQLHSHFSLEETNPTDDQMPTDVELMAGDELFAKFLYLVSLDGEPRFPLLDEDRTATYLIRKDVFLTEQQEQNLQSLFVLMGAMRTYFDPILEARFHGSRHGIKVQERIDAVMRLVKKYNALLAPLMAHGHQTAELDAFFSRLFSADLRANYGNAQDQLLALLEKDRDQIKPKPYVQLLRVASEVLDLFQKKSRFGVEIYNCLQGEDILSDVTTGQTVNDYWTKTDYKSDSAWTKAIHLVEAVAKEYKA